MHLEPRAPFQSGSSLLVLMGGAWCHYWYQSWRWLVVGVVVVGVPEKVEEVDGGWWMVDGGLCD